MKPTHVENWPMYALETSGKRTAFSYELCGTAAFLKKNLLSEPG
jgi:hypothetical protein